MREKSADIKSSKRPLQALGIHQGRKKEVEYWWTWIVWKPVSAKMRLSVGLGTMGKRRLELKVYKSSLRLLLLSSPLLISDNWEPEDVLIFFFKSNSLHLQKRDGMLGHKPVSMITLQLSAKTISLLKKFQGLWKLQFITSVKNLASGAMPDTEQDPVGLLGRRPFCAPISLIISDKLHSVSMTSPEFQGADSSSC